MLVHAFCSSVRLNDVRSCAEKYRVKILFVALRQLADARIGYTLGGWLVEKRVYRLIGIILAGWSVTACQLARSLIDQRYIGRPNDTARTCARERG